MNLKALKEIGLTQGETKVYLALLRLGTTKTGPLVKKAKVSSSKVYKILDRLQTKGLVGHITIAKTKHFSALEPKRILDYMEEKEKQLQKKKILIKKMLPELEFEQKRSKQKTKAMVVEGFIAIKNFFNNILDELKAGDEYYVLSAGYGTDTPAIRPFFKNFHSRRAKKKIKVKMLADFNTRDNIEPLVKIKGSVKFLPPHIIAKMITVFYKNKTFIFFLTTEPQGFLIENKEVTDGFKTYFNALWKIAKK